MRVSSTLMSRALPRRTAIALLARASRGLADPAGRAAGTAGSEAAET
jgi:hypothetical protein